MLKETEKLNDKQWLYEQYWGKIKTTTEIANDVGEHPRLVIDRLMQHGIPRRPKTWARPMPINPLVGFAVEKERRNETVRDCPVPRNTLPNCVDLNQ